MRTLIVLYAAAVVFGGAANLFRPYMKFAGVFYAVFAVGYFAFTGMWKFISRIRQNTKNLPEVTLYTSLGVKKVIGLIDTGNELRDLRLMIRSILLIRDWQSLLRHIRNGKKAFI